MASNDGPRVLVRFALGENEPDANQMVQSFALSIATALCNDPTAVEDVRILSFDTSDIDHHLLPEHRPKSV